MSSKTIAYLYRTLISQLQDTLNIEPILDFIDQLTANFFANFPSHCRYPPVQQIRNDTLGNLNFMYKDINIKGRNSLLQLAHRQTWSFSTLFTYIIYIYLQLTFTYRTHYYLWAR